MPPHLTLYLRREVFERWGNYDTSYGIAADYDAILRWLGRGGISLAYLPDVLVKMRMGGASNRSLSHTIRKSREDYRAITSNRIGGLGTLAWKNASNIGQFSDIGLHDALYARLRSRGHLCTVKNAVELKRATTLRIG